MQWTIMMTNRTKIYYRAVMTDLYMFLGNPKKLSWNDRPNRSAVSGIPTRGSRPVPGPEGEVVGAD